MSLASVNSAESEARASGHCRFDGSYLLIAELGKRCAFRLRSAIREAETDRLLSPCYRGDGSDRFYRE